MRDLSAICLRRLSVSALVATTLLTAPGCAHRSAGGGAPTSAPGPVTQYEMEPIKINCGGGPDGTPWRRTTRPSSSSRAARHCPKALRRIDPRL